MKKNNLDLSATKRDLQEAIAPLTTKEELKKLVTKKEFRRELAKLATEEELVGLEKRLRLEIKLTAQETKEEIREDIKESKSEILKVLDSFLRETEISQQERVIAAEQASRDRKKLENHEERISTLEEKVLASV